MLLLFSIFIANFYFKKFENNFFDKDSYKYSSLYQEDTISYYFPISDKIINDKNEKKSFFISGDNYDNSFLYPRIIYIFNYLFNNNEKIFNEAENKVLLKNHEFFIYLQILVFYFSLVFLYLTISRNLDKNLSKIICIFLFLNPIIFQYHLSFYTESLFLTFLILLISFLLRSKSTIHFLFIGIFVGIMYMQRTIALMYPLVIFTYILFLNENFSRKIFNFFSLMLGMIFILFLIGFHNLNRMGVFYFTPTQTKLDLQRYIEPNIIKKSEKISHNEAIKKIKNFNLDVLKSYKYDLSNEADRIKFSNKIQGNSFKTILENKEITLKIIFKNYYHSMLLNPLQVYYETKYQTWEEYKNSSDHKFWLIIRLIITPIFFIFSAIGLVFSIKKIDLKFNIFLFLSISYFFVMGCWLPNTRYFTPSVLFMGIYFSIFLYELSLYLKKKFN
ncbi:MAG: glycosyltransferase family 39 protein [Candidatus Pelagibacter sp.]